MLSQRRQFEVEQKREDACSPEERHSNLVELIVWRLFARQSGLWIPSKTAAGNSVPLALLVTAYTTWKRAVTFAAEYGVGRPEAAEVLAKAAHSTADYIAKRDREGDDPIRDIESYHFKSFMRFDITNCLEARSKAPDSGCFVLRQMRRGSIPTSS